MIALFLALLLVQAWWAKDSFLGRTMRELTATGVRWFASVRPLTILCFVAVVAAFAGLIAYGQFEGMILAGLAAPETFAMFLAVDVGTALEVAVLTWLAVGRGHLRVVADRLRAGGRAVAQWTRARGRERRPRRARRRVEPANDDEPGRASLAPLLARAA